MLVCSYENKGPWHYFWFIFHFLHSQNKSCNEAITKFEEAANLRRADIIKTALGEEWQENRCWWIRWAVCVNCCWKVTDCFLPEIIYMFPFICLHVLFVTLYICHLWCLLFLCDLFLFIKLVILGQPIYFLWVRVYSGGKLTLPIPFTVTYMSKNMYARRKLLCTIHALKGSDHILLFLSFKLYREVILW